MTLGKPKPAPKPKKRKKPPINKAKILAEYRSFLCECGCGRKGEDLHHCLIHAMKYHPELDVPENLVLITHQENVDRKYDNLAGRKKFWQYQCRKYGTERMLKWLATIPPKLRSRIDFC